MTAPRTDLSPAERVAARQALDYRPVVLAESAGGPVPDYEPIDTPQPDRAPTHPDREIRRHGRGTGQ